MKRYNFVSSSNSSTAHTTGIPFGADKELEIIKQMYDVSCLFEAYNNFDDVYSSYMETVKSEIAYRGVNIKAEDALMDTIETAACVLKNHEIEKINNPLDYRSETISKSKYSKLSKIRNLDPEGFAYVVSTIRLLDI